MKKLIAKAKRRQRRKLRIREIVRGTSSRPRLSVFRSNLHFYCQAIDDLSGTTLVAVSDLEKDLQAKTMNSETVKKLGQTLGQRLKEKKIETVVFDLGGFQYHGVIKNFADAIRESGIKF